LLVMASAAQGSHLPVKPMLPAYSTTTALMLWCSATRSNMAL
jgi:hypothetical protein